MGEHHRLDQAYPLRHGGSDEVGGGRDDVGREEEGAELSFGHVELAVEEVGDPGGRDEAGGERVDGEEEREGEKGGAGFTADGGEDGFFLQFWNGGAGLGLRFQGFW